MLNKECIPFIGGIFDGKLLKFTDLKNGAQFELTVTAPDKSLTKYYRYDFPIGQGVFVAYALTGTRNTDVMMAIFKRYGSITSKE